MTSAVIDADEASFDAEVLRADVPVLLDFWAPWCGPCKALASTIDALAEDFQGRAKIVKVNADENPSLMQRYNVRGLPHLMIIKDGEPAGEVGTLRTKSGLGKLLDTHVANNGDAEAMLEANLDDPAMREEFFFEGELGRVRAMLEKHPEYVNAPLSRGGSPVSAMVASGLTDRVALFADMGAEMSLSDLAGAGKVDTLAQLLQDNPALADDPQQRPLMAALRCRQRGAVDLLLGAGVNLNWQMDNGLHPYLARAAESGDVNMLRHLVAHGMELNVRQPKGYTLMHTAAAKGDAALAKYLIEQGLDPMAKSESGETPVDIARKRLQQRPACQAVIDLLLATAKEDSPNGE